MNILFAEVTALPVEWENCLYLTHSAVRFGAWKNPRTSKTAFSTASVFLCGDHEASLDEKQTRSRRQHDMWRLAVRSIQMCYMGCLPKFMSWHESICATVRSSFQLTTLYMNASKITVRHSASQDARTYVLASPVTQGLITYVLLLR